MRKLFIPLVAAIFVVAAQPARAADPNDEGYAKQYGVQQMNAQDAWVKATGEGVIVAVVDTGVDLQHPEFADGKLVKGYDFGDGDDNPDDDSTALQSGFPIRGHGTGGAGVIAAITDNGKGIAGVARNAKIMPLKVAPRSGPNNFTVTVPQAINYALENGAKVINLSIGALSAGLIGVVETPCDVAYRRGVLCVLSSGNGGTTRSGYARGFQGLLVTANDADGKHSGFAQHADTQWAVSAPGQRIYMPDVLEDGGYQTADGTSFSAPHASGVAALLFSQGLSISKVIEAMLTTATPMDPPEVNGAGLLNAARAVGAPVVTPYSKAKSGGLPPGATGHTRGTLPPSSGSASAPARGAAPKGSAAAPGAPQPEDTTPGKAGPDYGPTGAGSEFLEGDEAATVEDEKKKTSLDPRFLLIGLAALLVVFTGAGAWSVSARAREAKRLGF